MEIVNEIVKVFREIVKDFVCGVLYEWFVGMVIDLRVKFW